MIVKRGLFSFVAERFSWHGPCRIFIAIRMICRRPTTLCLCLLVACFAGGSILWSDQGTIGLASELQQMKTLRTRLLTDVGSLRLLYLERREGDSLIQEGCRGLAPDFWTAGIDSPWLTCGPVSLQGSLAQLYNPLGYGPGSEVFSETADITLNIDLESTSRRALFLDLLPGSLGFFFLQGNGSCLQQGGRIAVRIGGCVRAELLYLLSEPSGPPDSGGGEPWFYEHPPYPGGLLSHLGGSLSCRAGGSSLQLAAAACGGQHTVPGLFSHLHALWAGTAVEAAVLAAARSPGYFTPDGDSADPGFVLGTTLDLYEPLQARSKQKRVLLKSVCRRHLRVEYNKEISRPAVVTAPHLESCDRLSLDGEASLRLGARSCLRLRCDTETQVCWSGNGRAEKQIAVGFEGGLECSDSELAACLLWEWERPGVGTPELTFVYELDPRWGRLRFDVGVQLGMVPGWKTAARLELTNEKRKFHVNIETEGAVLDHAPLLDAVSVTLGWQTTARFGREAESPIGESPGAEGQIGSTRTASSSCS